MFPNNSIVGVSHVWASALTTKSTYALVGLLGLQKLPAWSGDFPCSVNYRLIMGQVTVNYPLSIRLNIHGLIIWILTLLIQNTSMLYYVACSDIYLASFCTATWKSLRFYTSGLFAISSRFLRCIAVAKPSPVTPPTVQRPLKRLREWWKMICRCQLSFNCNAFAIRLYWWKKAEHPQVPMSHQVHLWVRCR